MIFQQSAIQYFYKILNFLFVGHNYFSLKKYQIPEVSFFLILQYIEVLILLTSEVISSLPAITEICLPVATIAPIIFLSSP